MTLKIFIDTEFTDFIDTHLISIGMAADSGEEFSAEVPYPDRPCSAFVREAVIPLLGRLPEATCSVENLHTKVMIWLNNIEEQETSRSVLTTRQIGNCSPMCWTIGYHHGVMRAWYAIK
ncbi:MAG: hypothetical protein NVSMB28_06760 [Collimonas sp.]